MCSTSPNHSSENLFIFLYIFYSQAYCNIITGGALCIGLRYAGTDNLEAFATLKKTFDLFHNMNGWYVGEYSGKATVESCLILILIAMSLVSSFESTRIHMNLESNAFICPC